MNTSRLLPVVGCRATLPVWKYHSYESLSKANVWKSSRMNCSGFPVDQMYQQSTLASMNWSVPDTELLVKTIHTPDLHSGVHLSVCIHLVGTWWVVVCLSLACSKRARHRSTHGRELPFRTQERDVYCFTWSQFPSDLHYPYYHMTPMWVLLVTSYMKATPVALENFKLSWSFLQLHTRDILVHLDIAHWNFPHWVEDSPRNYHRPSPLPYMVPNACVSTQLGHPESGQFKACLKIRRTKCLSLKTVYSHEQAIT